MSLVIRTMAEVRRKFNKWEHYPSERMYDDLNALCAEFDRAIHDRSEPVLHVTGIGTGIGKTTVMQEFIRQLVLSPDHDNVGVMVCVSMLKEIASITEQVGLAEDQYAILIGKQSVKWKKELAEKGLPRGKHQRARVIFTTHAFVEMRMYEALQGDAGFRDIGILQYETPDGAAVPRKLRIWDEALTVGRALTLSMLDLSGVVYATRKAFPGLAQAIYELQLKCRDLPSGSLVYVENMFEKYGLQARDIIHRWQPVGDREHLQNVVYMLERLCGRKATFRISGKDGERRTVLDFDEKLPEDAYPAFVLDASARVSALYDLVGKHRGIVKPLVNVEKRYDNVTFHVWSRGSGKGAWSDSINKLAPKVAEVINTHRDDKVLVVHHGGEGTPLAKKIRGAISERVDSERTYAPSFVNWGAHRAVNDFRDHSVIIVTGVMHMPSESVEALVRAQTGIRSEDGPIEDQDFNAILAGSQQSALLQVCSRGTMRVCEGEQAKACTVYLITPKRNGLKEALPVIFEGCSVMDWVPKGEEPRVVPGSPMHRAVSYIKEQHKAKGAKLELQQPIVAKKAGINPRGFNKRTVRSPAFKAALRANGVARIKVGRAWCFVDKPTLEVQDFTEEAGYTAH